MYKFNEAKYEEGIIEIKENLKKLNELINDNFNNSLYKDMRGLYTKIVKRSSELYNLLEVYNNEINKLDDNDRINEFKVYEEKIFGIDDCLDTAEVLMETANQNLLLLLTNELENFEEKVNKFEDKVEKQQGVQFTVFSIVISIISFIMTNSKVLTDSSIDLGTVLVINFSYLLAVSSLFALIYLFMGIIAKKEMKIKNLIILLGLPILFAILVFVSYFVF